MTAYDVEQVMSLLQPTNNCCLNTEVILFNRIPSHSNQQQYSQSIHSEENMLIRNP